MINEQDLEQRRPDQSGSQSRQELTHEEVALIQRVEGIISNHPAGVVAPSESARRVFRETTALVEDEAGGIQIEPISTTSSQERIAQALGMTSGFVLHIGVLFNEADREVIRRDPNLWEGYVRGHLDCSGDLGTDIYVSPGQLTRVDRIPIFVHDSRLLLLPALLLEDNGHPYKFVLGGRLTSQDFHLAKRR